MTPAGGFPRVSQKHLANDIKHENQNESYKTINLFVSMPFHASFDSLYENGIYIVRDYIKDYNLNINRADKDSWHDEGLEKNILKQIDQSDILIADISYYSDSLVANVNVMHEIGYAIGRSIPVILIGRQGGHKIPTNLAGRLFVKYDEENQNYLSFSVELSRRIRDTINNNKLPRIKPEFSVEGFFGRRSVHLDRLIRKASRRVFILTTNLTYTLNHLTESIKEVIENNKNNPDFKVEILTMDPESSVANERAVQLGKTPRIYRDELRESLERMIEHFEKNNKIEIMTYTNFPTQMTFIIDNLVVLAVVSMSQLSRESVHFLIEGPGAEPFLRHFSAIKTNRTLKST